MRLHKRAFTLAELVVYFALSVLALGLVFGIFFSGRRNFESTSSSYLVSQDAEAALRWMRADLKDSALGTIRVYPNPDHPDEPPGISMASPRDKKNAFMINDHGAPLWTSYIYYTLNEKGQLIRWLEEVDFQGLPVASSKMPSDKNRRFARIVLRNVCAPEVTLPQQAALSERGGFDLQFVRWTDQGDEVLTSWNPAQITNGEVSKIPEGRSSKLIQLLLTVSMANFREAQVSYVQLPIRIMPSH